MSGSPEDTIVAIATPPGEGALAVIRLSGRTALAIADLIFRPAGGCRPSLAPSHTVHYGHVIHDGRTLDEVLLTVLRAPRTFTREDTIEISGHGGSLVSRLILGAALASGARMAEPGEFTKRAFLNGRLDLTQAEAVADVIHSRTEIALQAAHSQLEGRLSKALLPVRSDLLHTLTHIEAHLDFPEEDISPHSTGEMIGKLEITLTRVRKLLETAAEGRILRQGLKTALIGRPNAGKSSLMNRLLGMNRSIVSPIPGTTRDTIEEIANLGGIPVTLIDTAGLRLTRDPLEAEGVRRSEVAAGEADFILHVVDGSEPITEDDLRQMQQIGNRPHLTLLNKSDKPARADLPSPYSGIRVSGLTGEGMDQISTAIQQFVWSGERRWGESAVAISARHANALRRTLEAAASAQMTLQSGAGLELAAFELRTALNAIGEVAGEVTTEELLDSIFSRFCIGK